ncbi:hypothetical protein, conserved [Eimeria acervulina]|uniref:Transmembrane protein n=1 Tax=Eimeria acervulina TaxID=5801 RepID=U6GGD4_EIMAC|nr:hypothetical protein, conserved [Eimeria acervulina]CDI79235.1 hypothetical protein, conserved [Eimeria acervulina]
MEDPASLLKGKDDRPSVALSREYDNLYQLELKYWSVRTLRKTVRYTGCVALTGQLIAALFCFIAAPWADSAEKNRHLRLTGCILLSTFSGSCLFFSIAAVGVAWVTSVKAHVGNALLFASFHLKSLMYSSCACAISAALLKCIGFLFFTIGTQQLIAALAEGALPKGFFAFAGYSHLWWLSPLIAAAVLAAVLLLCHYLELLLAVSRGGYHIFCPPNPHLYSLDDLARDAAQGRPLSLSPSKPRSPPSVAAFAQLFREKLSPRLQGPAMAQQRRTVGGPASAATRPAATDQEALVTERKFNAEPSQQTKASSEGAWLVALWLRGSFFLASLGALCIALSLGLCAMVSDSGAAFHGSRGPAAFDEISNLLLATQRQPMQQVEVSFVTVQQQKPLLGGGAQLARNFLQQQEDALFLENQRLRWQQRSSHLSHVLQAPAENSTGDAFHISSMVDHGAEAISGNSFLHLRRHDGPQKDKAHHQHGMKSAAALLLLALVLLTPIIGTSLAEWIEDIFFAHMVLIKRNPCMIVPPPTLAIHPRTPVLEPAKLTEAAPASADSSDPLLHLTPEKMTHHTPQNFLGLHTQPMQEQQPEQPRKQQTQGEQEQQP